MRRPADYYSLAQRADRRSQTGNTKPTLSKEKLLAIIAEVAGAAEGAVRVLDAAMRESPPGGAPLTASERLALDEARAHLLISDLEEIQERAIATAGVTSTELDAAFAYYNSGPGRDRRIIDAAASVRKALGKHLCVAYKALATHGRATYALAMSCMAEVEVVRRGSCTPNRTSLAPRSPLQSDEEAAPWPHPRHVLALARLCR